MRGWPVIFSVEMTLALALLLGCEPDDLPQQPPTTAPVAAERMAPAAHKGDQLSHQREAAAALARVRAFFDQHCVRCHGAEQSEGELRLDTLADEFDNSQAAGEWIEVMNRLNLGEMPPPKEPRPEDAEQQFIVAWISRRLEASAVVKASSAQRLRRLTRTEYAHSIRDLLNITFEPGDDPTQRLPPDGKIHGFDKLAGELSVDPSLMEAYLQVALQIAERAVLSGDIARPPVPTERHRFEFESTPIHPYEITTRPWTIVRPEGLILMHGAAGSRDALRHSHGKKMIPARGRYTVRVRAGAHRGRSEQPVMLQVWRGGVGQTLLQCEVTASIDDPAFHEVTLSLDPEGSDGLNVFIVGGENFSVANELAHQMQGQIERALAAGDARTAGRLRAQMRAEGAVWMNRPNPATLHIDDLPRLFLDYIEIEGPLYEQWPPRSHTTVLNEGPHAVKDLEYARRIFARLLPRAYRRAVTSEEIESIVGVVAAEHSAGDSFKDAIRAGVATMLCSPDYLYVGAATGDDQLAERLAYFLWSSLPDDDLREAATKGQLRDTAKLLSQVERLLQNTKSDALATDFAAQWLMVDEFARFAPDRELYPAFYRPELAGLDDDLRDQPLHFFRELLRKDVSVMAMLDSDWTMANQRLARFYGLPAITGSEFRRVELPRDSQRGGLLGMAGVHRWGSDGNRTKPVARGVYVLEVLLNNPPSPPPPNAGEVEPNLAGKNLSVRARLAGHRSVAACAACHDGIDPYGLARENFKAIGLWRDVQDGEVRNWFARGGPPAIDASGVLPDGQSFATFAEFKQALVEDSDRFRQALAEKLLAYALARRLTPTDQAAIDGIVAQAKQEGDTLRAFVRAVVASDAFRRD